MDNLKVGDLFLNIYNHYFYKITKIEYEIVYFDYWSDKRNVSTTWRNINFIKRSLIRLTPMQEILYCEP